MCSGCLVQLLSVSPTPTLPYAALCLWDSAHCIPSLPAGSLGGVLPVWGAGWERCRASGKRGARFFPFASCFRQLHLSSGTWPTVSLGFRVQHFFYTFQTKHPVPLRSTSHGRAATSHICLPSLQDLSKLLGSESPSSSIWSFSLRAWCSCTYISGPRSRFALLVFQHLLMIFLKCYLFWNTLHFLFFSYWILSEINVSADKAEGSGTKAENRQCGI